MSADFGLGESPIGLRETLPLYPSQFMTGIVVSSLGPLLDSIMKDLGVPLSRGGLISMGLFLGQVIGLVLINVCMARMSAKAMLVWGAVVSAAGLIGGGLFAANVGSLFASFVVVGVGWSIFNAVGWMWVPVHMKNRTPAMILQITLFYALGNMIGPLIIGPLIGSGADWRWILTVEGLVILFFALSFLALPFRDIPDRENLRARQTVQVVRFNPRLLAAMLIAGFLYVGIETSFMVWLPKFQIDVFHASDARASLTVSVFWLAVMAGRIVAMRLSRVFFPSRIVTVCGIGLAVFSLAIAFAPAQVGVLVLALGAGLGASASFGLLGSYSNKFPAWHAGVVSSIYLLVSGAGSMAVPYLIGPLAASAGFRAAIAILAVPAVGYALMALYLHVASREGKAATEEPAAAAE